MGHVIEPAKSGRASCRTCKSPIAKGELRLGVEVPNQFAEGEPTYQWHHLLCAVKKQSGPLREAMAAFAGEIPDRAGLEAALAAAPPPKPSTYPWVERASTGRSRCLECEEAIEKGALRVAIEREVDAGGFMRKGPGYLHAGCALAHTGIEDLLEQVKRNSPGLDPATLSELEAAFAAGGEGDAEDEVTGV